MIVLLIVKITAFLGVDGRFSRREVGEERTLSHEIQAAKRWYRDAKGE
jgi:hypothetical protein